MTPITRPNLLLHSYQKSRTCILASLSIGDSPSVFCLLVGGVVVDITRHPENYKQAELVHKSILYLLTLLGHF